MLSVENFNTKTGDVTVVSDAASIAEQLSELRSIQCKSAATDYARKNGIVVDGIRDMNGRDVRYYDKETGDDVTAIVNTARYADHPELLAIKRIIPLSLAAMGGSTLSQIQAERPVSTPELKITN